MSWFISLLIGDLKRYVSSSSADEPAGVHEISAMVLWPASRVEVVGLRRELKSCTAFNADNSAACSFGLSAFTLPRPYGVHRGRLIWCLPDCPPCGGDGGDIGLRSRPILRHIARRRLEVGWKLFRIFWRRGGDSNPRYSFRPYDGLANRCFRPLSHLSGDEIGLQKHGTTRRQDSW